MKKLINDLIGQNKIKEAIEKLRAIDECYDDAIPLSARWNALQSQIRSGTTSFESASISRNQIIAAIQMVAEDIKNTPDNQSPIQNDQEEEEEEGMTPLQKVNLAFDSLEEMQENFTHSVPDIQDAVMWLDTCFTLPELVNTTQSWGLRAHQSLTAAERTQVLRDFVAALLVEKADFITAAQEMTIEAQDAVAWEELWNLAFALKTKEAWEKARNAVQARLKEATFSLDQQYQFDILANRIDNIATGPLMWGYKFSTTNDDIINWVNKNLRG